ncbi:hypothetical protein THIOSC15_1780003 [uncultured Thiomicrorhabdus sp.]
MTYSDGSNAVIHNKNRASTTVSKFGILEGVTVTNDGELLRLTAAPLSVSPSNKIVGVNDMDDSWKLKKNTKYALKLTNININDIDVYANFEWAEHEML